MFGLSGQARDMEPYHEPRCMHCLSQMFGLVSGVLLGRISGGRRDSLGHSLFTLECLCVDRGRV